MLIKNLNKLQKLALMLFFISSMAIGFTYYVEHYLEIEPCSLCLYQRYPYYLLAVVAVVGFLRGDLRYARHIMLLYSFIFMVGGAIALYHTLVEHEVISEPTPCTAKNSTAKMSIEDVKALIFKKNNSCKEVKFKIFGASMAELNFAFSLIMVIYLAATIFAHNKNKRYVKS